MTPIPHYPVITPWSPAVERYVLPRQENDSDEEKAAKDAAAGVNKADAPSRQKATETEQPVENGK